MSSTRFATFAARLHSCRLCLPAHRVAVALLAASLSASASVAPVIVLDVHDAIGPASADYIVRGIAHAGETGARLVVIELDTPGGLDTSMRQIVQAMLRSSVPVAVYVSPQGARAASAGTYILYAAHIAAMAPATTPPARAKPSLAPTRRPPSRCMTLPRSSAAWPSSAGATPHGPSGRCARLSA
jgi:membrane-bound serine protease (ClpP class)